MPTEEKLISGDGELKQDTAANSTSKEASPPTDFKIAEIWIRSGQIQLDAAESFWSDRFRALGMLEFCKEIVKTARQPAKKDSNIGNIGTRKGFNVKEFVNRMKKK